jgi:hypothetical protein
VSPPATRPRPARSPPSSPPSPPPAWCCPARLHGPYWQWTRKIAAKTIGRWLSADQHHDYQPWIDNDRRLHELLTRLEILGTQALEADPRWER